MYNLIFKRIIDFTGALALSLILLPLLSVVGLLVYFDMDGRVFFIQERVGYKGKIFKIYKFKTMSDERGPNREPLPDEKRVTSLGKFLRRWSIDELPGLFNVLQGDMSLVGPRPLVVKYLDTYSVSPTHSMAQG